MAPDSIYINGDIAALICKEIRHQKWHGTLSSIARASKLWNAAAVPELYRNFVLDFRPKNLFRSKQILNTLKSNTVASYAVQDLLVKRGGWFPWVRQRRTDCVVSNDILEQLSATIPSCRNLKTFEWNIGNPLPNNVIQFLNTSSQDFESLGLFAASFGSKEEPKRTWRLPASQKITNLKVCIGWEHPYPDLLPVGFPEQFNESEAPELHRLIVNLPNLDSLDLSYNGFHRSFPFPTVTQRNLPNISKLTLRNWSFIDDWSFFEDDQMSIQRQLNFQSLKLLKLFFCDHIDKLFHSLQLHNTQLDCLFVSNPFPRNLEILPELCNFLISQETLKELGLYESMVPLPILFDCLRSNHMTLTALALNIEEVDGAIIAISPADIQAICDICTNLEFLQIELPVKDLDASTSLHLPVLKTFQKLTQLRIHTFQKTGTFVYQHHTTVRPLAEAIWASNLKQFDFVISNYDSRGKNCVSHPWLCMYDETLDPPGFRVIDRAERKYEKWLKRLAKVRGEEFVPLSTIEEKRKGWEEAVQWFEKAGSYMAEC